MRRASYTPLPTQAPSEPLIVVEESGNTDDESGGGGGDGDEDSRPASPPGCDSPLLNPCLLSPYRDMRKRSLPTPACTSGITASQVRRLSEHGVGTEGAAAREAAFLATLQQAPTPAPGGRRHSVVTISRAPPSSILFGRGRRESIAAFPSGGAPRVLPPRRDSVSAVPPRPPATSGATSGSTHNLQLDIMDDIAEIKAARKVRLKMWRTPSRERVCEVQPLDGGAGPSTAAAGTPGGSGQPTRYQSRGADAAINRRYSDFVSAAGLAPAAGPSQRRRASEQPPSAAAGPSAQGQGRGRGAGIVCTNSDLISILSSLASSAQEINRDPDEEAEEEAAAARAQAESPQKKKVPPVSPSAPGGGAGAGGAAGGNGGGGAAGASGAAASADQKRSRLKSLRSNSFDVSMLLGTGAAKEKQAAAPAHSRSGSVGPASWFIKRHQPKRAAEALGAAAGGAGAAAGGAGGGGAGASKAPVVVTYRDEKANVSTAVPEAAEGAAGAGSSAGAAGGGGGSGGGGGLPVDNKVVWDGRSGSVVDAQVLGSAIEDFLARRGSGNDSSGPPSPALQQGAAGAPATSATGSAAAPATAAAKASPAKAAAAAAAGAAAGKAAGGSWFSAVAGKEDEEAAGSDTCDSSICSTLKDLFVK
ncbi:hypothetical protein R5R35_012371 [Gryllus longicercus]|uniref:Uncharacterized protein n=1 Tax=Gryllus longicercus TaxID=2509291 RepID=A0AAN9Z5E7_9ORTH